MLIEVSREAWEQLVEAAQVVPPTQRERGYAWFVDRYTGQTRYVDLFGFEIDPIEHRPLHPIWSN